MNENDIKPIAFEMPKNRTSTIKVFGVGGGGSNAVNYMYQEDITGVDFIICNTDVQDLESSPINNKIQIGKDLTEGMGAGNNPEMGEKAAEESREELKEALSYNTKMVFITAGMGGGTGTGAAPVIAKIANEMGLLTVGIVTFPFDFEGKRRQNQAKKGIDKLREYVDSLIIINNNKLREVYGDLGYKTGFAKADEVLSTAAKGIAEVITHRYKHNIDLNDAKTVLSKSGTAIMGSARADGDNRAIKAITGALDSPLLNDNKITGAKNVLLLIVSGTKEITIDEIGEINEHISQEAGHEVDIIMGVGDDETLGDSIAVTIIATGFSTGQQYRIANTEPKKIIHTLDSNHQNLNFNLDDDEPVVQRFTTPLDEDYNNYIQTQTTVNNLVDDKLENEQMTNKFTEHNNEYDISDNYIHNLDVIYDEVNINSYTENDFIVHNLDENQLSLTFDFDIENNEAKIEQVKSSSNNAIRHHLDYEDLDKKESTRNIKKSKTYEEEDDELLNFEIKTKPEVKATSVNTSKKATATPTTNSKVTDESLTPFNMSIEQFRQTTEIRKKNFKQHNYTFRNNTNSIESFENEPAYIRRNVDLNDDNNNMSSFSRISISGDKDEIKLRSNNSFLHDNVD